MSSYLKLLVNLSPIYSTYGVIWLATKNNINLNNPNCYILKHQKKIPFVCRVNIWIDKLILIIK